jgi:hypothetical protein
MRPPVDHRHKRPSPAGAEGCGTTQHYPFNDRIVELYKQEYCSVTKWRAREMSERMGESGQPFSSVFALYSSACAAFKFFTDSRTKSSALWMDLMFRSLTTRWLVKTSAIWSVSDFNSSISLWVIIPDDFITLAVKDASPTNRRGQSHTFRMLL